MTTILNRSRMTTSAHPILQVLGSSSNITNEEFSVTTPKQRHVMFLNIERQTIDSSFDARTISKTDYQSLGNLMLEAYRGTVDYDGESLEDSIGEIKGTLEGKYGTLIGPASYVIEENGVSAAAVIFTINEKEKMPLLTFAMTDPAYKNKGMSKYLIRKSLNSLLDLGYKECFLVVTDGNQPAQSMYEKMGFKASKPKEFQKTDHDYSVAEMPC